jgi:hypothetical protein
MRRDRLPIKCSTTEDFRETWYEQHVTIWHYHVSDTNMMPVRTFYVGGSAIYCRVFIFCVAEDLNKCAAFVFVFMWTTWRLREIYI